MAQHARLPVGDPTVWVTISRVKDNGSSDGNGPDFDVHATEVSGGVDFIPSQGLLVGAAFNYSNGDLQDPSRLATGNLDSWGVAAYGRYELMNQLYMAGQVAYDWHHADSARNLMLGGLATGKFDAHTWTVSAEAGGNFVSGGVRVQPHIGFKLVDVKQDGFVESGPAGALTVAPAEFNGQRLVAGLRLMSANPMARIQPYLSASYERDFGDRTADLTNTLAGLPSFAVTSSQVGRDIFSGDVGLEALLGKGVSLFVTGRYSVRKDYDSQSILGGIRVSW